jgi:hypothetical protein
MYVGVGSGEFALLKRIKYLLFQFLPQYFMPLCEWKFKKNLQNLILFFDFNISIFISTSIHVLIKTFLNYPT